MSSPGVRCRIRCSLGQPEARRETVRAPCRSISRARSISRRPARRSACSTGCTRPPMGTASSSTSRARQRRASASCRTRPASGARSSMATCPASRSRQSQGTLNLFGQRGGHYVDLYGFRVTNSDPTRSFDDVKQCTDGGVQIVDAIATNLYHIISDNHGVNNFSLFGSNEGGVMYYGLLSFNNGNPLGFPGFSGYGIYEQSDPHGQDRKTVQACILWNTYGQDVGAGERVPDPLVRASREPREPGFPRQHSLSRRRRTAARSRTTPRGRSPSCGARSGIRSWREHSSGT